MRKGNGEALGTIDASGPMDYSIEDEPTGVSSIVSGIHQLEGFGYLSIEGPTKSQEVLKFIKERAKLEAFKPDFLVPYTTQNSSETTAEETERTMENAMDKQETFFKEYIEKGFKNIEDKLTGAMEKVDYMVNSIKESVNESKKDNQNIVNMIQSEVHEQNKRVESIDNKYSSLVRMIWITFITIVAAIIGTLIKHFISN